MVDPEACLGNVFTGLGIEEVCYYLDEYSKLV